MNLDFAAFLFFLIFLFDFLLNFLLRANFLLFPDDFLDCSLTLVFSFLRVTVGTVVITVVAGVITGGGGGV